MSKELTELRKEFREKFVEQTEENDFFEAWGVKYPDLVWQWIETKLMCSRRDAKREVTKLFKKWFVRRPNGNCQVLLALTELDGLVDEIDNIYTQQSLTKGGKQ